ncbi:MAG: hypothetical protein R2838_14565 [Caldilineaceae bacterium]
MDVLLQDELNHPSLAYLNPRRCATAGGAIPSSALSTTCAARKSIPPR